MGVWNQSRINRDLYARAVLFLVPHPLDDPQKFDRVAELTGELNVGPADGTDTFDMNVLRVHPEPMSERSQNADLVLRIPTVDIEVGRCFGVALFLRVNQ